MPKEVLFYECPYCCHKGANDKYICSYCNTPLDMTELAKYNIELLEMLLQDAIHNKRAT